MRLHGISSSIVSDRDSHFASHFYEALHGDLGTKLRFNTAFHLKTDGQTKRMIQTLEDMLRACILNFHGNWDDYLSLVEFAYNNSHHTSIGIPPYEVLYGRLCKSPICWEELGERALLGPEVIE